MKITQQQLHKIILEEYLKEEGLDESQAAEDLLRQLIGDEEYERRRTLDNPDSRGGDTAPMEKPNKAADTMPFGADPEPEVGPESLEDQIADMVKGMPPEEVSDLFQAVFAKIPGVEIGSPEEEPESLYTPGAEGRPAISLGPLREAVFEKLMEAGGTMYRGMGAAYKRDDEEEPENEDTDTDEDTEETEEDV